VSAKVYACISHKGGTGRTTTTANVAYRLALRNRSVCCVDLDLDSPTFGAVAGLRGMERGAPIGIHDFLHVDGRRFSPRPPDLAGDALVDIWQQTELPRPPVGKAGRLRLLPGGRERLGLDLGSPERQGKILGQIVARLRDEFDHVLLDVRSGASDTVEAVLAADDDLHAIYWLVFFRWTPQHLAGAADLCERLTSAEAELALIRTAYSDATEMDSWFREQHRALTLRARELLPGREVLTDIPVEPMLQWKEGIITEEHLRDEVASESIVESYEELASKLEAI
jgi:MinD-like ATPase involved in chromosome partitioning or flagellar assembly